MLHKFDKIDAAMAACVALEYPLIVAVHDKLPSAVNNAEEAARGTGAGGRAAFSFLPASYSSGSGVARTNSSFFTDASDSCEVSVCSPSDAAANAALGPLMRPANLTAAADASAMAQAVADGEELALVPDFSLGRVQGGAAQREALLVTLLESRLGSATLLHVIEAGTPDYAAFSSAVPVAAPPGSSSDPAAPVLPRLHLFFPPSAAMAPIAMSGSLLTPVNVYNCVQMGLLKRKARGGSGGSNGASTADELRTFFTTTVAAMNRSYARSRQSAAAPAAAVSAPATQQQQQHRDTSAGSITAAPAARAKGVTQSDVLAAAHLITVTGLPMSLSSTAAAPSAGTPAAHKTLLTAPSMTLQTVWRTVEKHLEWAQREMQQAQANSVWNGVVPPKPGTKFTLSIDAAPPVSAASYEAAAKVRLQDYPRNTAVKVHFEAAAPASASAAPSPSSVAAAPPPAAAAASSAESAEYVCEGDVCRRRTPADAPAPPSASAPVAAAAAAAPAYTATPAPSVPAAAASVKLRCSLPNGKTLDVTDLDPAVATLRADVRPAVAGALGHDAFVFVCAYPPKRYSAETDEPQPLKDVGLGRSGALRVVTLDGPGSPNASSGGAVSQQQQRRGPARQMLSSAASSLMSMFAGGRGQQSGGAPPPAAASASSSQQPPPRRTYNSMAEMLAANEDAERQTAVERLQQEEQRGQAKKSNRYFGGDSTEFIAEDGEGGAGGAESKEEKMRKQLAALQEMTPEQQNAFLQNHLRQMIQRQRQQAGEAEEGNGEGEGESGDEGEGGSGGASGGHRAFQGQGRRLAGDAPAEKNQ